MNIQHQAKKSWRPLVYFIFSLAITGGVFFYLLNHITLAQVIDLIRNADRRTVAAFILLAFSMNIFRTWRYKLILRTSGHNPGCTSMFLVVLVRNLFSDLLPARIGTLIYVYILTNRLGVPFGAAMSSFALSFAFDLIALVPLILIAILTMAISTQLPVITLFVTGAIFAVVAAIFLFALPRIFHLITWSINRLVSFSGGRFKKLCLAWETAETEIYRARAAGIYLRLLFLSLLVRITKYVSLYILLHALISPLGYGFTKLSIARVFIGLCSAELAASLPISGLAGFGVYEGTWALVFKLLGFPEQIANLTSISHHLFAQVYGYGLGAIALIILLLPVFKKKIMMKRFLFLLTAVLSLTICVVLYLWNRHSQTPSTNLPVSGSTAGLRGIVAYEYKGGIWCAEIADQKPKCLSANGSYPRWSSDGGFLAFQRGNKVMRISADGNQEECLAEGKTVGAVNYHPNGREILFIDGQQIKSVSLENKNIRTILTGYQFAEIDISADGKRLVCTVQKPIRILAVNLVTGEKRNLARECSASLSPDGKLVTSLNGRHTKLNLRSWDSGEPVSAIDSPAGFRFDNQFWSNHPDWIASQAELGKRRAGDIYIHQVSKNQPVRVTFTTGCDRPDLFVHTSSQ